MLPACPSGLATLEGQWSGQPTSGSRGGGRLQAWDGWGPCDPCCRWLSGQRKHKRGPANPAAPALARAAPSASLNLPREPTDRAGSTDSVQETRPDNWGRCEDLWVTTLQDDSCRTSFSVSDPHCTHSASQRVTRAQISSPSSEAGGHLLAPWPHHEGSLKISVLCQGVKYGGGGGEGTTGLVTEAGEACCQVCSLDPHLGPQAHLDSSVLRGVLKSETHNAS